MVQALTSVMNLHHISFHLLRIRLRDCFYHFSQTDLQQLCLPFYFVPFESIELLWQNLLDLITNGRQTDFIRLLSNSHKASVWNFSATAKRFWRIQSFSIVMKTVHPDKAWDSFIFNQNFSWISICNWCRYSWNQSWFNYFCDLGAEPVYWR